MRPIHFAAAMLIAPAVSFAQTPSAPAAPAAPEYKEGMALEGFEDTRIFELGVELFGTVTGSFISEPEGNAKLIPTPDGRITDMPYPGYGGVGGGGGIALTGMYLGIVGFDFQLSISNDAATGEVNGDDFTFSTTALHLPLHLRLAVPGETVRPFVFGGVEFVFPGEVTIEESPAIGLDGGGGALDIEMNSDSYYMWSFGFGFDFILPVEGHDLRIPFKVKGAVNPNVGSKATDRMTLDGPADDVSKWQLNVDSELEWQAAIQLGLAYYFL